jgi:cytochrome P450 family 142 subfamily A polypeptide 1
MPDFDVMDFNADPQAEAEALARLRREDPVHWDAAGEWWLVTRHADVKQASRSPELFSSEPHGPWHAFESHFSMQAEDGPPHHLTRNVVSHAFTPRAVSVLEEKARHYTDAAIDAVIARGSCDVVQDIAVPVPMRIIADLLGVGSQMQLFGAWIGALTSAMSGDQKLRPEDEAIAQEFSDYIQSIVAERTARPREDLISLMLASREQGVFDSFARDPFPGVPPGDGVLGFISFLVAAGSETTRHAISQGTRALIEFPAERARLAANPALLPRAVEEILRWVTPVRAMRRTVMRDTRLGGKDLREGQSIVLLYGSANRDEAVFEDPQQFRVDRRPNDHVSFGFGTHFCMGANLARMEIRVAIGRILERLPDLTLAPGAQLLRFRSPIVNGLTQMPAVFTPQAA